MSQAERVRKNLIDHVLNDIRNIPNDSNYRSDVYYVIAKLGLQRKAKQEKLFEIGDWDKIECRDAIFERVKDFLVRYIK